MHIKMLIESIMQQTTLLIGQLSTAAGIRAPLARIADQAFVELAEELESQGVGRRVAADMFGMALRTYQKKLRRLVAAVLLVLAASCAKTSEPPGFGTNTNWLQACSTHAECGSSTRCLCGMCTRTCSTVSQCGDLSASAVCEAQPASSCGGSVTSSVCLQGCKSDRDCKAVQGGHCSGGTCLASATQQPDAAMRSDGGTARDAGRDAEVDASSSCEPAFVEAGTGLVGDAEVPVYHRATSACCPSERGPAPSGQPYGPGVATTCTSDSECTSGPDGRCFPFQGLVGPGGCSYDECFTDSDCPSGTPCLCRSSPFDTSTNVCVPRGNCVLDSDCGPGGYCSPSRDCYRTPVYYCHTASDTCINDKDCPSVDQGAGCPIIATCAYSAPERRWACSEQTCCLP